MTGRLIISGTREELSAEDRAMVVEVALAHAKSSWRGVGCCPTGVDALVRQLFGSHRRVFRADWDRLGNAAGPERNSRMVAWASEVPGGALAALPRRTSRGTWDCVRQARAAGLDVIVTRIGGGR